jgi:RES domain
LKNHKKIPPSRQQQGQRPRTLLELDRFSQSTLTAWKTLSADLDQLEQTLYFSLEPERRRLMPEMLAALAPSKDEPFVFENWVRQVSYSFSRQPLSSAGSLLGFGGRFNAGADLDDGTLAPWPCLYLAEDFETAFREKFQLGSTEKQDGLSPEELALMPNVSHVTVMLRGRLSQIFDLTAPSALTRLAKVLAKIKMPERARSLQKKLQIPANQLFMMRTAQQLHDATVKHNWRALPVQFGLPAHSHVLADLIRHAGYEGLLYPSSKGAGRCLAVFPEGLREDSFIALQDKPPYSDTLATLNSDSSNALAGWEVLPVQQRTIKM